MESRRKSKPVGTLLIERDLKKKGIDEGFIKEAIKTGETKHSEHDTALELARKRLDFYGKVHRLKAKRRIHDYLVRRGFKFDVISEVLSEVFV